MHEFDLKEYLEEALKDEAIFDEKPERPEENFSTQEDESSIPKPVEEQKESSEDLFDVEEIKEDDKKSVSRKKKKVKKRKKKASKKQSQENPKEEESKKEEKKSSSKLLVILPLLILLSGGAYFVWERYFSFETINPFELIMVRENGADGHGSLEIIIKDDLDDDQLHLAENLNFVVEENENIRLGDVKKVYLDLDEHIEKSLKEAKIKLEPQETNYTVKALSELESIDLFEKLEVDYHFNKDRLIIDDIHLNLFDASLEDLIEFKHPISVEFHEKYTIEILETEALTSMLGEKGYQAQSFSHELVAENIDYIPTDMKDIAEYEALKGSALRRIDEDYQKNNLDYHSFEVKNVCYSFYPENRVNAKDYYESHTYEDGSLMFIIEFKQETGNTTNTLADNYGYTNMYFRDGNLLEEKMKLMSPFQDKASVESIRKELEMNNFKCEVAE